MSAVNAARDELERRIETIEAGYEFMLAYAAQGRPTDKGPGGGGKVRERLEAMANALDGLADVARTVAGADPNGAAEVAGPFLDALERDALVARSIVRLVLSRADISSQLIDNLNASIHVRALLTDLFVVDEALKGASEAERK
ncbi:MAG: hypothetical protein WBE98_03540 [Gammaproteobacteria bacterium]